MKIAGRLRVRGRVENVFGLVWILAVNARERELREPLRRGDIEKRRAWARRGEKEKRQKRGSHCPVRVTGFNGRRGSARLSGGILSNSSGVEAAQ